MQDTLADAPDDLTSRVRELVAAGAWPDVVRLLDGVSQREAAKARSRFRLSWETIGAIAS